MLPARVDEPEGRHTGERAPCTRWGESGIIHRSSRLNGGGSY